MGRERGKVFGTVSPVVVPSAQVVEPPGLQPGGPGRRKTATTIDRENDMKPQERSRRIYNSALKTVPKLLAAVICDHLSSDDGTCWPGNELLARRCSMSVRRMQDHKRSLIALGVLRREVRGMRALYSIDWEALDRVDELSIGRTVQGGLSVLPTLDYPSTLTLDYLSNRRDQGSDQEATNTFAPDPDADSQQEQGDEQEQRATNHQRDRDASLPRERRKRRDQNEGRGNEGGGAEVEQPHRQVDPAPHLGDENAGRDIDPVAAVWTAWAKHHKGTKLTKPRRKRIEQALAEATTEEIEQAIEWFHKPDSWWKVRKLTTFEHLFTWGRDSYSFTSILDQIREHGPGDGPNHNGHLPADRAWSLMVQHCNNYRPPERWHENDATEARMRAATRSVGGWREIGKIDDYSRGRIMKAWCQAYTEARP